MEENEEEAIKLFKLSAEQVIIGFKFLLDLNGKTVVVYHFPRKSGNFG